MRPATELITPSRWRTRAGSRVVVGGFLAAVAIADVIAGGIAFSLMVCAAVMLIFWEWAAMHRTPRRWRWLSLAVLAAVAWMAHAHAPVPAMILLGVAIAALWALSAMVRTAGKRWISTGLAYAGLPAVALIWLRGEPDGFHLVIWTMGLVWTTDTAAFVAGRAIGGPKLWPRVSPNKTWAGLAGGLLAAAAFSASYAAFAGWTASVGAMLAVGALMALLAQGGDLFESWLKRRAGVKDSGRLLLSHGGIMDRVDGLVPVACAVAVWVAHLGPVLPGVAPA